jgi:hypothetical protein
MTALPGWLVLSLYGTTLGYGLVLDAAKVAMLRRVPVDRARGSSVSTGAWCD